MFLGFVFALFACLIWGLVFVIPDFISDFSTIEVVLGRYFSYGLLSCFLMFRKGVGSVRQFPVRIWVKGLVFGLTCNIFYYIGIVVGLRFATPPITVLIVGMAPILIAIYGNWHVREVSYKSLIVPSLWIAFGMILVNAHEVDWTFSNYTLEQYLLGLLGVLVALFSWTWYAVQNARFLKKNPQIAPYDWSTIIGVSTFFWTMLAGTCLGCWSDEYVDIKKFIQFSGDNLRFFIAVGILGVICSWLGCFLWNRASTYLPMSLMGPFLILETIFGLIFVYLVDLRLPSFVEILGFSSMLGGILLSVYLFKKSRIVQH